MSESLKSGVIFAFVSPMSYYLSPASKSFYACQKLCGSSPPPLYSDTLAIVCHCQVAFN